jgi:hypothetical protein
MSNTVNLHEQALVAILSELLSSGHDVDSMVEKVNVGILGNKPYTWVGANYKSAVLDSLKAAVTKAKETQIN